MSDGQQGVILELRPVYVCVSSFACALSLSHYTSFTALEYDGVLCLRVPASSQRKGPGDGCGMCCFIEKLRKAHQPGDFEQQLPEKPSFHADLLCVLGHDTDLAVFPLAHL